MESLFFHPKVVHLPIALSILMPLVAGGLTLAWWRGWLPRRAFFVAVILQVILSASAGVAMKTGEAEEDTVEKVVAKKHIHEHEEAAEAFTYANFGLLALFLLAGFVPKEGAARALAGVATLGTVAGLWLGYRVGHEGGELVYVRGAASAYAKPEALPKDDRGDGAHEGQDRGRGADEGQGEGDDDE